MMNDYDPAPLQPPAPSRYDTPPPLILASRSPRRQELMRAMGLEFVVRESGVDETKLHADHPRTFALRAAFAKARDIADHADPPAIVIAADTVVTYRMRLFGKPRSEADARSMLRTLSGQTHQVITGMAIAEAGKPTVLMDSEDTRVTFLALDDAEIDAYLATDEPFDKAGAYGIQGHGGALVESIAGDYYNVMGLPCGLLLKMLDSFMETRGFTLPPPPEKWRAIAERHRDAGTHTD